MIDWLQAMKTPKMPAPPPPPPPPDDSAEEAARAEMLDRQARGRRSTMYAGQEMAEDAQEARGLLKSKARAERRASRAGE